MFCKNTFIKETFEHEKEITQLQAITKYIAHFAKKYNYRAGKRLWMDPLPKYLYLEDIIEENKEENKEKKEDEYMLEIQLEGNTLTKEEPISVEEVIYKCKDKDQIYAVMYNGKLRDLRYQ